MNYGMAVFDSDAGDEALTKPSADNPAADVSGSDIWYAGDEQLKNLVKGHISYLSSVTIVW